MVKALVEVYGCSVKAACQWWVWRTARFTTKPAYRTRAD